MAYWKSKPPAGARLRTTHPLYDKAGFYWLFNEGGGNPVEARTGIVSAPLSGVAVGAFSGAGRVGTAYGFSAITQGIALLPDSTLLPTGPCTVFIASRKRDATNRASAAFGNLSATGPLTSEFDVLLPYSDGTVYFDYGGNSGTSRLSVAGLSFGDDIWAFTVGARGTEIWQNGIKRASSANNPTRLTDTRQWGLGTAPAVPNSDKADVGFLYVVPFQASADLIGRVIVEPFGLFQEPPFLRRFFFVSAASSAMAGLAAGVGRGMASIGGAGALIGRSSGVAQGVAAIGAAGLLAGIAPSRAQATAVPSGSAAAAGISRGVAQAYGTISFSAPGLMAGTSRGSASVHGALSAIGSVAGIARGSASAHAAAPVNFAGTHPAVTDPTSAILTNAGAYGANVTSSAPYGAVITSSGATGVKL